MTDAPSPEPVDYRDTVFLPKTDFPMKAGLPQKEPLILARWQEQDLYNKLRDARRGREKFILHDGPPYANGDMHIGHALNHILKDMVCRSQTLLGKDAPYVPGWDCHGLPIEWKVEEQYRKKKLNKDEVPAKEFRAECRAYAQHWVDTQREQLKRLGIQGDWGHPYLTMDFDAEATIVSELMKFAENGMLYRGAKPVMWSPVEKTALAEAEVEYEDIVSTQIDVAFEITESPIPELVGAHAVIWTTTPWTIPVNQALAYGPDVEYKLLKFVPVVTGTDRQDYSVPSYDKLLTVQMPLMVVAGGQLEDDFRRRVSKRLEAELDLDFGESAVGIRFETLARFKGSDLAGTIARHPMHHLGGFFARPRPFLAGDFVTTDSGTGLVHMSPDHGEDDFDLCKANGLDPVFAVEGDGKYRADWLWLGGEGSVINPKFNAPDGPICTALREADGLLAASADYQHSYPHSWRSKAKVIYRCTPQWFVPMDKPMPHLQGLSRSEAEWTVPNAAVEGTVPKGTVPGSATLRQTAMAAIEATRFVPEKGRNRIGAMVEGRPDWVLSRQRAWGVPITLFVHRESGEYLVDTQVNERIVNAVRAEGVDAWDDERAQAYLGEKYDLADYERIVDILDVWFDSGCTHVFTLESGRWPDLQWPADLYLEGSDQHRGWFQSSLLESSGTRGRAPYNAVLTHGFTMDAKGFKQSKSVGNTTDPNKVMEQYGADIIRLWALSVDFTEDHRIGDEILKGVSDQYRKLRNTFRYMLGALEGFSEAERVTDVAAMPELERYVLHLLADMDAKLKQALNDFDFNTYVRLISDFANEDLSAFFFDIRKDCLYCDAADSPKRMAYRTVLDILFQAMVRYAAPVLVYTAEEVWGTRYPDADSVHFSDWPVLPLRRSSEGWSLWRVSAKGDVEMTDVMDPSLRWGDELVERWTRLRELRSAVTLGIEPYRRDKTLGSSLEAKIDLYVFAEADVMQEIESSNHLDELCIVSSLTVIPAPGDSWPESAMRLSGPSFELGVDVERTSNHKCGRCWRHLPEVVEDGALCDRCDTVLND